MLKAYDYAERRMDDRIRDSHVLNGEKEIALKFVLSHPQKEKICSCPICGSEQVNYMFELWNVDYLFCKNCASVFVPVSHDVMEEYKRLPEMKQFRTNDSYQNLISDIRDQAYDEDVVWLRFRAYRYLGRNTGLDIIDFGDKYRGFTEKIKNSGIAKRYEIRDSILADEKRNIKKADIVISMNQLQHEIDPISVLMDTRKSLGDDGILILSTRLGSGFDILTLKGGTDDIYPYEHIMLPSRKGLELILEKAGYELLEITTPGTRDLNVVRDNKERLGEENFFVKYLLRVADERILMDFQQFLQKSCLSSFVRLIARKKKN